MLPAWMDSAALLVLPDLAGSAAQPALAGEPVRFGFDSCRDTGSISLRAVVQPSGSR
jgi:hypothetical protein